MPIDPSHDTIQVGLPVGDLSRDLEAWLAGRGWQLVRARLLEGPDDLPTYILGRLTDR